MPPRPEIVLDEEGAAVLERWAREPKSTPALALRCRIVLVAAEGNQSEEIAASLGCSKSTRSMAAATGMSQTAISASGAPSG